MKILILIISFTTSILSALWFYFESSFEPAITTLAGLAGLIGTIMKPKKLTGKDEAKHLSQHPSVLEGLTPDDVRKILLEEQLKLPPPPPRSLVNAEETSPISKQFTRVKDDVDNFYAEAENAYKDGNYFKALKYYEKAVRLVELPVIRIALVSTLITIGEYQKAIEQANIAIENIESVPMPEREDSKAQIHNLKGIACLEYRKYQSAEENFLTNLQYRKNLAEDRSKKELQDLGGAYINLAIVEQRLENFSQSLQHLEKALEIFKELYLNNPGVDMDYLAMTYFNIGSYHYSWGDGERIQNATDNFKEAKKLYEQSCNPSGVVACLINLGNLGKQNADIIRIVQMGMPIQLPVMYDQEMKRSAALFLDAIQMLTSPSDIESTHIQDLGSTLDSYGVFLMEWQKYTDAEQNLKKAVEIKRSLAKSGLNNSKVSLTGSLINLGKLYTIKKQYELSEELYEEAKNILEEIAPNDQQMYLLLNNFGQLKLETQNYVSAKKYLQEAMRICCSLVSARPTKHKLFLDIILNGKIDTAKRLGDSTEFKKLENYKLQVRNNDFSFCKNYYNRLSLRLNTMKKIII